MILRTLMCIACLSTFLLSSCYSPCDDSDDPCMMPVFGPFDLTFVRNDQRVYLDRSEVTVMNLDGADMFADSLFYFDRNDLIYNPITYNWENVESVKEDYLIRFSSSEEVVPFSVIITARPYNPNPECCGERTLINSYIYFNEKVYQAGEYIEL